VDFAASAARAAKAESLGMSVGGALAESARHHARATAARKAKRRTARAARRRNR
jgi:hypothetical protein